MIDYSLDRDAVVLVLADYRSLVFDEDFPFLFPIVGNKSVQSRS